MKSKLLTATMILSAALAATASAHAAGVKYNAAGMTRVAPEAGASPAAASTVQLAYSYTRGLGTDRSVKVLAFTNPSTGIYCIQPSGALKLKSIYPLVSIEWAKSLGEELQAFWIDTSSYSDCPAKNLEVQTWDISSPGAPVVTAAVAFDIVVP